MLVIFIFLFWIITFGMSFVEKAFDFKNTLSWLNEYLKNTPLRCGIHWILMGIIVLELLSTLYCLLGIVLYIYRQDTSLGIYGIRLGIVILLCFLIGQRLAKDYQGARGMVLYILTAFVSLYILSSIP